MLRCVIISFLLVQKIISSEEKDFEKQKTNHPNIVIFVADDLGWDDVSFHGSKQISTPNLDALASDGIILNNYYAAPLCTPSRGALFSAFHPIHSGTQHFVYIAEETKSFPLSIPLLPYYLEPYNYKTHIVGKWHLGFHKKIHLPTSRGFDSHYGYYNGKIDYFDHTIQSRLSWGLDFWDNLKPIRNKTGSYTTHLFTERAKEIISEHNNKLPLCLIVAYHSVHTGNNYAPLQAPIEYVSRFPNIIDKRRRTFAGMVAAMDDSVGEIIEALYDRNFLKNSIIIFTSDNGGPAAGFHGNVASNWPLRGIKDTLWEGGVRVPAFIWSPLLNKSHYVSKKLMHISDWLPTILEGADISLRDINDYEGRKNNPKEHSSIHSPYGISMWKSLSYDLPSPREELLLLIDPIYNVSAIRYKNWKLIQGLVHPDFSGWYPPFQYAIKSFPIALPSNVDKVLKKLGRVGNRTIFSDSFVKCGPKFQNASTNCQPNKTPCLFDIDIDPCEYNNVAAEHQDLVNYLWNRIITLNKTAVPFYEPPFDPDSFPQLNGYVWSPWCDTKICASEP